MEACGTFEKVCGTFLGGVKCPTSLRINTGCSTANDLSTYVVGNPSHGVDFHVLEGPVLSIE
jgi:hypothetical protein